MQLVEDEDAAGEEESEDEEDPECAYGDEEEDGESESDDYSDDASDEVSSDVASESQLSEEGQDWDSGCLNLHN